MNRITLILLLLIISINILNAVKPTVIYIEEKSNICSDLMILNDENNDGRYDYSFYYIWCRGDFQRQYSVIDNYGISDKLQYYTAHLVSGSYAGPDFTYVLKEILSGKEVAKLYNIGDKKIIIEFLPSSYNYNNNSIYKLDEYFYLQNQNGIITLSKKSSFEVMKISIIDLNGKTIYSSDIDQSSYYIDVSNSSDGQYYLSIIIPQNYLMKKITLLK